MNPEVEKIIEKHSIEKLQQIVIDLFNDETIMFIAANLLDEKGNPLPGFSQEEGSRILSQGAQVFYDTVMKYTDGDENYLVFALVGQIANQFQTIPQRVPIIGFAAMLAKQYQMRAKRSW